MRNLKARSAVITCILLSGLMSATIPVAGAAVKAGASCTSLGKVSTVAKIKFTCIKSGKKLVWGKGVAIATTPSNRVTPAVVTPVAPVETISELPKYQSEGCHAKVSATLQKKVGNTWVDITEAQGWERIASCDADHPYEPFARVDLANGTVIRWKIYAPGAWEWFSLEITVKKLLAPTIGEKLPAIDASKYSQVSAIARAAVTSEMPALSNTTAVTYTFENSIFPLERSVIKNGVEGTLSRYSAFLDPTLNVHVFVFATSNFLKNEAPKADPTNKDFADDMARQSVTWGLRSPTNCIGMGGFAVSEVPFPFIAIDAPCNQNDAAASGVLPHELTHILQMKFGSANPRCWAPTWLVEGGAQVGATALAVNESGNASDEHRKSWVERIVKPTSISEIIAMEGETKDFSEYTLGAALSEYLVAKGGWKRSLNLYTQAANQSASSCLSESEKLSNFNSAFQSLYGESLSDFYAEALPYLQWVATHR
jgi:hypothetical protein